MSLVAWKISAHHHTEIVRRIFCLSKCHEPLQALNVLSGDLIVEYVSDVAAEDLFATGSFVDADHGDTDRPGGVANRELEVRIIGVPVLASLHVVDDFGDAHEHVWSQSTFAQLFEQRF